MIEWWGPVLLEYYAGTEGNGSTFITSERVAAASRGRSGRAAGRHLHICDPEGNELPAGEIGGVYFSGGAEFEYHNDPEKTADATLPGGRTTLGDIGYVDEDGYLFLTDRKAHMIISGGVNIYPQEIEDVLIAHPAVADVAVFGVPDDEMGEQVKAVVQLADGVAVATSSQARADSRFSRDAARPLQVPALDRLRGRAPPPADRQALQAPPAGPVLGQDRLHHRLNGRHSRFRERCDGADTSTCCDHHPMMRSDDSALPRERRTVSSIERSRTSACFRRSIWHTSDRCSRSLARTSAAGGTPTVTPSSRCRGTVGRPHTSITMAGYRS